MKQKGITLAEVVITVAISAIVGGLLLTVIVNSAGIFYKESSKLEEGLNINDALSQLRSNIKQSSAIIASYSGGGTTYTSSDSQLVLKLASIDSSGNIIDNTFDYYVFFLDQTKLRFKTFPAVGQSSRKSIDQIFSTSVNSLNFQYFNSANPPVEVSPTAALKVRITLTLKQKIGANYETNTATSEANLRND